MKGNLLDGKEASISYLRIFATISIVWLHTCSTLIDNFELFDLDKYQMAFFSSAYQMMYWAVPVFFMITGALLLDSNKKITLEQCVKKYSFRIIIVLIIFGIPYAILKLIMENHGFEPVQFLEAVKAIIENNSFGHLWYLYVLMGLYLILPLLRKIANSEERQEVRFLLVVLFIIDFFFPLLSEILHIKIAFELPLKYPVFYVLAGYYINREKEYFFNKKKIISVLTIGCIVLIWVINYYWGGEVSRVYTAYTSPLIGILAILIFTWFITGNFLNSDKLWKIDRLCFGVYLIHPLFIQFVYRYIKITPANFEVYPVVTLLFFIGFTCCAFGTSWIMNRIKVIRKYIL